MFRTPAAVRLALGMLTTALGIALLAVLIRRVGWEEVAGGLAQIRWGFAPILALAGARLFLRAFAWTLCLDPSHRLPLATAFAATISGDALGNLTPLGPLVSEPAKAAFVRDRVPIGSAFPALAVENLFYVLSVAVVIALGLLALLASFDLSTVLRRIGLAALAAMLIVLVILPWLVWRRPRLIATVADALVARWSGLQRPVERLRALDRRVALAARHSRGRLTTIVGVEALFHLLGVTEVYLVLWLMSGTQPGWLAAFVLETQNRLFTVVFKLVPLRIGVDEAGAGVIAQVLGFGTASGVALALVRKVRILFWSATGALLLVRRGLAGWQLLREPPTDTLDAR